MIRRICNWGLLPFVIICLFPVLSVRDNLVTLIGEGATNSVLALFGIYAFFAVITQFTKIFARFANGVFILFITLITLVFGYNLQPERRYEHALSNSRSLTTEVDKSNYKNEADYSDAVDALTREQKARQLEVEVADLRYYTPNHKYGIKSWMKIVFLSCIGLMLSYGICWLIVGYKDFEIDAKNLM